MKDINSQPESNIVVGRNAVAELLKSGRTVDKILIKDGTWEGSIKEIAALARQMHVPLVMCNKSKLDFVAAGASHQGIIAIVPEIEYSSVEEILDHASMLGEKPFICIADGINDPHNFGSIIRVCECAGVDGIVIGRNRQVAVTDTVARCSAGAIAHMKIARVTNVNNAIKQLQQAGLWVYACDMDGQEITSVNLTGSVGLVIGGEGSGVGKLTREVCDGIVSLKLKGKVNSLNASVACGIAVYEVVRQRG